MLSKVYGVRKTPLGLFHGGVGGPTMAVYYPENALCTNMHLLFKIAV